MSTDTDARGASGGRLTRLTGWIDHVIAMDFFIFLGIATFTLYAAGTFSAIETIPTFLLILTMVVYEGVQHVAESVGEQ